MPSHNNLGHPSRRANRWLVLLIAIMIVTAGTISATVTAPPSPLVGTGFAVSALVFAAALILAGRITIALERARRRDRPAPIDSDPFPLLGKLVRRR